jgi:membrane associated rhomboid family serine protease
MNRLKKLRSKFERFCYQHRTKGIPNLMLYVTLGSAIVYILSMLDQSYTLYNALRFDRNLILQGQVWRLFTYVFTYDAGSILFTAIGLICYYSLGQAMENVWGTLRFNLFYLSGVVMMDIFCLIFGGWADISYLNMSLFLGYATMYPDARFLLLYIIQVKAWIFAVFDLALTVYSVIQLTAVGLFPYSLFPLVAIANYFLFFGKDVLNVIPLSWRANASRLFRKAPKNASGKKPIQFHTAGSYEATTASVKAPYTHRCTVCGRTDLSNPELEFRYCSRCSGYHCYCQEHISNHTHIQ